MSTSSLDPCDRGAVHGQTQMGMLSIPCNSVFPVSERTNPPCLKMVDVKAAFEFDINR